MPRISAASRDRVFAAPGFRARGCSARFPARLRQVSSTGAVTVVATSDVVPWRATVDVMRSSARASPSITSWPPAPWMCTSTNPGHDRHAGGDVIDAVGRQAHLVAMADGGDAAPFDDDHAVADLIVRRQNAAGMDGRSRHGCEIRPEIRVGAPRKMLLEFGCETTASLHPVASPLQSDVTHFERKEESDGIRQALRGAKKAAPPPQDGESQE